MRPVAPRAHDALAVTPVCLELGEMPYRYKEKFEKDAGYRLFRDKKSVLVHTISYGRRLTAEKVVAYDAHTNRYLDAVLPRASNSYKYAQALKPSDFPDVKSEPLYKY